MRYHRTTIRLVLTLLLSIAVAARGEDTRSDPAPRGLEGVGVREKLGDALPLDLTFNDEYGKPVTLRQLFARGKPVVLDLGYYGCPMLCGLVINGLTASLKDLSFTPGQEFAIINVSIDPSEKPALARAKKGNVIADLGKPAAATGWHFLTGEEAQVRQLADAVGFRYRWDEAQQQFAHAAVLILVTPDGKVSRYLYGVRFPAQTLRLSLVEAGEGKIGTTTDQLLLYCFHFDPAAGSYTLAALNIMRAAGVLTVLVLAVVIGLALWREARRRATPHGEPHPT